MLVRTITQQMPHWEIKCFLIPFKITTQMVQWVSLGDAINPWNANLHEYVDSDLDILLRLIIFYNDDFGIEGDDLSTRLDKIMGWLLEWKPRDIQFCVFINSGYQDNYSLCEWNHRRSLGKARPELLSS